MKFVTTIYKQGRWNWKNCWRITFILLLIGAFFSCMDWKIAANVFGGLGGVTFILMFVIRFKDVGRLLRAMSR
jgi:hypothetical protein